MKESLRIVRPVIGLLAAGLLLVGAGCDMMGPPVNTNLNEPVNLGEEEETPVVDTTNVNVSTGTTVNVNSAPIARQIMFPLAVQNASGVSGQALITERGAASTRVLINMVEPVADAVRPAHIHLGSCPTPGAVKWTLANVMRGKSTTDLAVGFDEILKAGALSINLHKSSGELDAYIACGDVLLANLKPYDPSAEAILGAGSSAPSEDGN